VHLTTLLQTRRLEVVPALGAFVLHGLINDNYCNSSSVVVCEIVGVTISANDMGTPCKPEERGI